MEVVEGKKEKKVLGSPYKQSIHIEGDRTKVIVFLKSFNRNVTVFPPAPVRANVCKYFPSGFEHGKQKYSMFSKTRSQICKK